MKKYFIAAAILFVGSTSVYSQARDWLFQLNTITTAVPFLAINPETRGGGMGDVGVATSADGVSQHWNTSKYAFIKDKSGFNISYTPWLRSLVPDIALMYLSGYYKIDKMSAVSGSLRYFSLGSIQFTDQYGNNTTQYTPNEFALDLGYSRKLSDRFSAGLAARYINSNLTGGQIVGGATSKAGQTVAVDLNCFYQNSDIVLFDKDAEFAWGLNISNLGAKIAYTDATTRDYLPINLRVGPRLTLNLDDYNSFTLAVDINKYLVPTMPVYYQDSTSANGDQVIASGMDPNRPIISGVLGSFYDAPGLVSFDNAGNPIVEPGSRFGEELREIMIGTGVEYWYDKQFAARAGYFHEHISKGNRKYLTFGLGLKMNVFAIDFSYLIPTNFNRNIVTTGSPLARTLRFSLSFNFSDTKKAEGAK